MKREIWKPVVGYEGLYMVSNYGRVKSLARTDTIGRPVKERFLKQFLRNRYPSVDLSINGASKSYSVHYLVWVAFNGPIPECYEINHIDQNPKNNKLSNLNLLSHKDNLLWGTRLELVSKALTNHPVLPKPVVQYDLDENIIKEWASAAEAARVLGLHKQNICACCAGRLKMTGGFKWKYKGEN